MVFAELAPLGQQLQGRQPPLARDHLEVLAIGRGDHGEVLQQPDADDGSRQFGNRGAAALAHVARRRPQLGQRDQAQFIGHGHRDGDGFARSGGSRSSGHGMQGLGFGMGNGIHGDDSLSRSGTFSRNGKKRNGGGWITRCSA